MRRLPEATHNNTKSLLRDGKSTNEVEKELGVSRGYIYNVRREDKENIPPPKMGRPCKVSKETQHLMVTKYNTGTLKTLKNGHHFLESVREGPVCDRTIKRYLRKEGCSPRIKQKAPAMTDEQKMNRKKWAKKYIKWGVDEWKQVMFSDESTFERFGTGGRQYYYSNAEHKQKHPHHFRQKMTGGGGKVQVWGCITYNGVGDLEWVDGTMEKEHYCDILRSYVVPSCQWNSMDPKTFIFQHDNSSVHTAKIVKRYLSRAKIKVLDWPANSPDISPIERVWGHIDEQLNHYDTPPKNKDELFARIENIWNNLPPNYLNELYRELPEKMQMLVKTNGLHARVETGSR